MTFEFMTFELVDGGEAIGGAKPRNDRASPSDQHGTICIQFSNRRTGASPRPITSASLLYGYAITSKRSSFQSGIH